ncbi:MAG: hypothetical protein SNJ62_12950 [Chloracidobacterium sp.]
MDTLSKFAFPGVLFVLTLVFGFLLSHASKPYNAVLFNIHKLIALASVALAVVQFFKTLHAPNGLMIALLVVAALCVIALFVSGAMMSAGKLDHALMLNIHRVAPWLLTLCCALALYFLMRKL